MRGPLRVLLLTFYYPPDLSAGSFRAASLARALRDEGIHVEVVTTHPNRYRAMAREAAEDENGPGLAVRRIALPPHQSGMLDQARAFTYFARGVVRETHSGNWDVVVATSSRLMTAALGAHVARRIGAPLYLDIRDVFVETLRDLFPSNLARPLVAGMARLERRTIHRAQGVSLVSAGFLGYFRERYPNRNFSVYTNGVDEEFAAGVLGTVEPPDVSGPVKVVYAGNIGAGQGLERILPELAKRLSGRVAFRIIGDGGRRQALQEALAKAGMDSVRLSDPMPRRELLRVYGEADVLFLHLNDYAAFKRVLPSKLFEYAATGKPIWAGLSGYSAEFVRAEISNAAVFEPCNADGAVRVFDDLQLGTEPRPAFVEKYSRRNIARRMAAEIIETAERGR